MTRTGSDLVDVSPFFVVTTITNRQSPGITSV